MSDITLAQPLPESARAPAAALYWQAFSGKLGRALGPEDRALAFLSRVINPAHAIAAMGPEGALLGVAGFKDAKGAFVGGTFGDLAAIYGIFGAIWRAALLSLLERAPEAGVLGMDGICVDGAARGRGVGTLLLQAILAEAGRGGYHTVRLDVIDSNPRARALYERMGFEAVAEERLGPLAPLFGFRSATRMHHALAGQGA